MFHCSNLHPKKKKTTRTTTTTTATTTTTTTTKPKCIHQLGYRTDTASKRKWIGSQPKPTSGFRPRLPRWQSTGRAGGAKIPSCIATGPTGLFRKKKIKEKIPKLIADAWVGSFFKRLRYSKRKCIWPCADATAVALGLLMSPLKKNQVNLGSTSNSTFQTTDILVFCIFQSFLSLEAAGWIISKLRSWCDPETRLSKSKSRGSVATPKAWFSFHKKNGKSQVVVSTHQTWCVWICSKKNIPIPMAMRTVESGESQHRP